MGGRGLDLDLVLDFRFLGWLEVRIVAPLFMQQVHLGLNLLHQGQMVVVDFVQSSLRVFVVRELSEVEVRTRKPFRVHKIFGEG